MPTALVTGASRGVGRGIVLSLAGGGYKVFATGRTIEGASFPEAVVRVACDHTHRAENDRLFDLIQARCEVVDLLVNNAWGGYERMLEHGKFTWGLPFWAQPEHRWTSMMETGVRAAFECSARAASLMTARRNGLIVNISFWAARKYIGNAIYGIAKAATDKMTADMAHELRPFGVTVVSLYPGLVRTEAVLSAAEAGWLDLSNSESPEYIGRVIHALAGDPEVLSRTGRVLIAAEVGGEYGIVDIDGRTPTPLSPRDV
jgi:dehydrogenase/reductase SDR family protein 1